MATSPEVERARQNITSSSKMTGVPLPPLDPLAVSVLVVRSLASVAEAQLLLSPTETATLLNPVLQNSNAFVCTSIAKNIIEKLREPHKMVLRRLLRYLCRLSAYSTTCTASGMAQTIGPVLLRPERLHLGGGAQDLTQAAITCTRNLIE